MSRLGPTGLTQLLTNIKTWVTTKLGNYVTTDTTQTVTGKKLFTASSIQLDSVTSMYGSTMLIDTSASAPRGEFPAETHRVGRIYIGDGQSYNGAWFIVDPIIDTNRACYRMVTTNPDNTDSTRFSIVWDSTKEGVRRRKNVSQGDLLPSGASTYNLGELGNAWQDAYINNIHGISDYTNFLTSALNANTTLTHAVHGRRVILAMGTITLTIPAPEEGSWFLIKAVNGLVTLNLASNVTVTGITAGVFSGPIYLQPNESILLCYYSSTTYNATISTIRRSGVVGRDGNVPAENPKHWFKVAENYVTATYRDPFICLRVFEGTTGNTIGTLCAHCRINNTVGVVDTSNCYLQWQDAGSGIDLSKYALTTNETSGTGVTIALWCTLTGGYSSLKFEVVSEYGTVDRLGNPEWVLTRRRQADGDLAELLDTDFTKIVYSTLTTLKNDTTGKAGEANKVQTTIAAGTTTALVQATVASNDCFRIAAGGAANAGWAEIATGDDANEPIYVRQYKGNFTTLQRTATLLDGSGNTSFPGTVTATGFIGKLSGVPTGTMYVTAVKDGGALVNSQATAWGAIWRAPTKDYQVAGATWSSNNNNVYICYSVTNANAEAGTNTVAKSLIWAADTGTLTTTTFSGALSGNASSATQFSANKSVTLTGDVTGTASSKAGWSVATTLANSGVTAGDYGPSADASPAHSGTFTVPSITVDAKGRITAASTKTITLPSDNNTDTKVTQTVTTGNTYYPAILGNTATATATETSGARFSKGFLVNTRYSTLVLKNTYDSANTKGVRNTATYQNGCIIAQCYDGTEMGRIHCESSKGGYQQTYIQARSYIKDGAISPEGTATTCYITVRVRDNGSKTIYTDGSWENSLTPYANNTHSLGTSSLQWKNAYAVNFYENKTALSSKYVQINSLAGGNVAGSLTHSIGSLVLAYCDGTAFNNIKLYANVAGLQLYPCRTEMCTIYSGVSVQFVPIVVRSTNDSNLGSGTWRYLGGSSVNINSSDGKVYGMFLRVA